MPAYSWPYVFPFVFLAHIGSQGRDGSRPFLPRSFTSTAYRWLHIPAGKQYKKWWVLCNRFSLLFSILEENTLYFPLSKYIGQCDIPLVYAPIFKSREPRCQYIILTVSLESSVIVLIAPFFLFCFSSITEGLNLSRQSCSIQVSSNAVNRLSGCWSKWNYQVLKKDDQALNRWLGCCSKWNYKVLKKDEWFCSGTCTFKML